MSNSSTVTSKDVVGDTDHSIYSLATTAEAWSIASQSLVEKSTELDPSKLIPAPRVNPTDDTDVALSVAVGPIILGRSIVVIGIMGRSAFVNTTLSIANTDAHANVFARNLN